MSARDDYPRVKGDDERNWAAMCDEIDRLRAVEPKPPATRTLTWRLVKQGERYCTDLVNHWGIAQSDYTSPHWVLEPSAPA